NCFPPLVCPASRRGYTLTAPRGYSLVDCLLQAQDRTNDQFIAPLRVEHRVIYGTVWPFHLEVFLNKSRTLFVTDFHLLCGFVLTNAVADETPDFFIPRCVKEHAQSIIAVA